MLDLIVDFPNQNSTCSSPRVSFSSNIEMKFVENLSIEHKSTLWHTPTDMENHKRHAALVLRCVRSMNLSMAQFAENNVGTTEVFMGLENFLRDSEA